MRVFRDRPAEKNALYDIKKTQTLTPPPPFPSSPPTPSPTPKSPPRPPNSPQAASSPPPPPISSGFSVLFCRLYFAATSGVCLIRSGAAGFPKKLHAQQQQQKRSAPPDINIVGTSRLTQQRTGEQPQPSSAQGPGTAEDHPENCVPLPCAEKKDESVRV